MIRTQVEESQREGRALFQVRVWDVSKEILPESHHWTPALSFRCSIDHAMLAKPRPRPLEVLLLPNISYMRARRTIHK